MGGPCQFVEDRFKPVTALGAAWLVFRALIG